MQISIERSVQITTDFETDEERGDVDSSKGTPPSGRL